MSFGEAPRLPDFLASEMPFARGMYTLAEGPFAGYKMHFVDHGPKDGLAVVMIHGNPTWSFLWRKVIARLEGSGLRCLAPDLLGLGFSDKPKRLQEHSLQRHIDTVCEWLQALEVGPMVLVGQDWGGPVSVGVGANFPTTVAGVVLGNTSVLAPKRPRGTAFHRFARMPIVSDFVFRVLGFPQDNLGRVQGDRSSIAGEISEAYRWPLRRFSERIAPLAMARMAPDRADHPSMAPLIRGQEWLQSFAGPIELVWGERDPILGKALKRHAEAFPQARVTQTQAGHFFQEEVPQEIADAILRVAAKFRES